MNSKKILLKNGRIIDERGNVHEVSDMLISDGKIEKISSFSQKDFSDYETVDCSNLYITPGFVNLHTHSPMSIMKGIAEDISIDRWFNEKIFPYESKLEAEDVYWGAMLASLEMIDCGVTAFADHYFNQESVYKAVLDSGIRADIAPTIFGLADDYKNQLESAVNFVEKYKNANSRIHLRLGPHAPYTCPGEKLTEIINSAKKLGVGIHLHVSETLDQVQDSIKLTGKTPMQVLYESGGFDVDVIIAHGLWTTRDDLKFVNENAHFSFCPKTYLKLSMGNGNIYELKDNLNYSFGTDGAASSNTLNPLEQARIFALNGKNATNDAENFTTAEIWNNLMNGHNALKFNTGKIKEGFDADLLFWNLNKVNTFPVYDPLTSIIYSSNPDNIVHTMVQGEFLKYDGKLMKDTEAVLKNVQRVKDRILLRGKGKSKVNYN
ncbi:amidohydrolase family protein [Sedimentibacter sp. B4]|uniref:amidohydrolase family protein n=1 Tax=Sedimentibacter sp. B4 TaxID=304766 RepID=UPI00030D0DB9|nr:amidohydrolase family protein [Sedimentibacter sp. B4]